MNKKVEQYYFQEPDAVINEFSSSQYGLSSADAKKRILESGYNELPEAKRDSYATIFLSQFKSPLIYILLTAGVIVFAMGETMDSLVIFFVLLFNAIIGTIQEGKAQNTFLALKKFIKGRAMVLRDNEEVIISDRELVSGDIIILREGEKVPADARLINANSLKVNESALTGESVPKFKTIATCKKTVNSVMNQTNMVYKGTVVVSGNGKAVVVATGINTFLGNIAEETLGVDGEFPLKGDIRKLSNFVIVFVVIVSVLLFLLGLFNGLVLKDIFKTMVAVSVSIIPEGLPIVITLVLASGVWRMGKKNVLIKKLQAVEVLGETKILAVDKTGTVTKNELVVESVYIGQNLFKVQCNGYAPTGGITLNGKTIDPLNHLELLMAGKLAALNSSANLIFEKKKKLWKIAGDPTEGAVTVFSKKIGFHRDDLISEEILIDEIPFDYELKFHATLHKQDKNNLLIITGSPEVVLELSEKESDVNGFKKITVKRKHEIQAMMQSMFEDGLRVIGFAYLETKLHSLDKEKIPKLVFGGFFAIKDALRSEVKSAVRQVAMSGIKVVMITGDHESAARSIAKEAGIFKVKDEVLSGEEIRNLTDNELASKISNVSVFARITPDQKLRIIKAYQSNGMVIAMTGDGVNDALSLTASDIGIGMGKIGTEVAKEASDLILLDDNFANITHGVEEGRNIFNTIKKVVLYLFSTSLGEVLVILGALFLGFPLPILAAQILWLNLVTDGFLDMALAMEPKEDDNNRLYKKTFIIDKLMMQRMFFMALPMAIGTIYLFSQYYQTDIAKAWTISLTTMAVFQWFNVWNCRSKEKSIFVMNPFSNKFLVSATGIVVSLQLLAVYNPFFQKILRTVPLSGKEWLLIALIASSIIIVEELRKIVYGRMISK
ncbi:MAG: Cation-transporting ATPase, E1-E2 family [Candidatus Moranbacteria bacterium GW2011_GWC2_37_73]|nr:MAG: Cation-transporting ATPase, E1-E2 family [Parcubacteria group bacterium GW2011_GWC1_36_108]KKQ00694.1 MAG: Cation-transporting ATPase, E1-E2 family [Candidatus Moranbacteria bacterium GW2011_GWD1_36_198]KKQ01483.1 MAG: Cation-transporting ATPase, E1-E2 family [Candidatus Moranbacteria bacterium GW2011_GWD2_36_198]KKQ40415.1 MAG: Cation-transporting ATPase, E1-E2 family [Candidatus Moranbacteria bacterium GW2011_GWC2_37_73]HAR99814.1 ATPase [Candidatus Moranbacteria bacterium]